MFRKLTLGVIFLLIGLYASAKPIDFLNTVIVDIPAQFQGEFPRSKYSIHEMSGKYLVSFSVPFVYYHSYLTLNIELYGKGDRAKVTEILGVEPIARYNEYNMADQLRYLRKFYEESPKATTSGTQYSRFLSEWGTGWFSDYLGYYYRVNGKTFQECFVTIYNSWGSFATTTNLTMNQDLIPQIVSSQSDQVKQFYILCDQVASTLLLKSSQITKSDPPSFLKQPSQGKDGLYLPTVNNLRWREAPNTSSAIFDTVPDWPLTILEIGPKDSSEGKSGNWVRITTRNRIGWAFDGYLRRMTDEEIVARTEE